LRKTVKEKFWVRVFLDPNVLKEELIIK